MLRLVSGQVKLPLTKEVFRLAPHSKTSTYFTPSFLDVSIALNNISSSSGSSLGFFFILSSELLNSLILDVLLVVSVWVLLSKTDTHYCIVFCTLTRFGFTNFLKISSSRLRVTCSSSALRAFIHVDTCFALS